ncbi:hypothetical protein IWW36_003276 [Coemansia brasiliensis]|uniref:SAM domain-containing protein n=1 Tax=Coemansia brasiliensis TaxID=2650707 RepID=A0A9W8I6N8_9FUNG|nr:hypothetical protein IWW36_003276 [Coemansia brasiliensis]
MASPPCQQQHQQNQHFSRPQPLHPLQWSADDVARWAQSLPLIAAVAPVLREHAVDGHVLVNYVTNAVLADELGVAAFGTRVHVLEAIEALRWSHAIHARPPQRLSPAPSSSPSPESSSGDPAPPSKRSASRIADAEKKRQKRAALKQNPVLYAEYLQKERERNARRRARLRAERAHSSDKPSAPDTLPSAPAYAPYAADPPKPVIVRHSLQPPPHNLRSAPDAERPDGPAPTHVA